MHVLSGTSSQVGRSDIAVRPSPARSTRASGAGVSIERVSRLVGHSGTTTTETIYRKQIRPVIVHGADVMDRIFPAGRTRMPSYSLSYSPHGKGHPQRSQVAC